MSLTPFLHYTAEELLELFYKQGLPLIVSKLKEVIDLI